MAIQKRRDAATISFSGEDILRRSDDLAGIATDKQIRTLRNRDGTLGVLPEGEAGHSERGGLLLNAAGIGQDQRGSAEEAEEIEIADGRNNEKVRMVANTYLGEALLGAR